jgi:hypothetical protein
MRMAIRIRPRFWLAVVEPRTRWGWVPLSLIFRKQRLRERPIPGVPRSLLSLFQAFWSLSQIRHFHAHENRQTFAHSIQHQRFSLKRTANERPVSTTVLRRPEAPVGSVPLPEQSIEKQLRSWTLHELRQSFVIARHLREITKQVAEAHGRPAWPAESMIVAPARQLLATPGLPPRRISEPASPQPESQREVLRATRRTTCDVVVEEQLTSRLRKTQLESAAPSEAPFTPRSVDQVWRRPQHPSREPSSDTRRLPAATQSAVAESPVHTRIDPPPMAPAPAFLPTKLEGLALERLADDVMKRIERHLRIERERRGI